MNRLGEITVYLLLTVSSLLLGGFIFMELWGWFVAPVFDLPALRWSQAIGLFLFIEAFKTAKPQTKLSSLEELVDHCGFMAFASGIIWLLGWILSIVG